MKYVIIAVIAVLVLLGLFHFIRRQINDTREQLKHVDRSKLKDLDHDAWSEDEHDDDQP